MSSTPLDKKEIGFYRLEMIFWSDGSDTITLTFKNAVVRNVIAILEVEKARLVKETLAQNPLKIQQGQ